MYAMLTDVESSYSPANAPSSTNIEAAIRQAVVGSNVTLIGPRARIVRKGGILGTVLHPTDPSVQTHVAWLVSAPGPQTLAALPPRIDRYLAMDVGGGSHDWTGAQVTVMPNVSDADIAWWNDPHGAGETYTRDGLAAGQNIPDENPIGQNIAAPPVVQSVTSGLWALLGIGILGAGTYAWIASAPARASVRAMLGKTPAKK